MSNPVGMMVAWRGRGPASRTGAWLGPAIPGGTSPRPPDRVFPVTYTGDVRVGGPSDTREINGLTVTKIAVGAMRQQRLPAADGSGQGLLIDAAAEPERLLEMIGDTPVSKIVTTHQHPDHWQALAEVKAATGAVTVAHPADAPGIPVPTDELVEDGGTIAVRRHGAVRDPPGRAHARVASRWSTERRRARAAPVHRGLPVPRRSWEDNTPGGLQHPDERRRRVFGRLPDATWVYPGHGDDTTLGAERPHLEEWRARGW